MACFLFPQVFSDVGTAGVLDNVKNTGYWLKYKIYYIIIYGLF